MNRVANLARLITLAVLVTLHIGGSYDSSSSEVSPSPFIGQTLNQVVTSHWAIMAKLYLDVTCFL